MISNKKTYKILLINPAGFIGGAEKGLLNIIRGSQIKNTSKKKLLFYLVCPKGDFPSEAVLNGARYIPFNFSGPFSTLSRQSFNPFKYLFILPLILFDILKLIARLIIICKKIRPEIIHSNGIKSHVISGAAGIFTGIKPFFHIRDITSFPADFIIAFTALLSKGTLIFNSRASRKNFLKLPSLFKNIKKYVIYNGIETDNIDHFKKNKLNTKNKKETKSNKNNRIIFFSMGHLAPLKGYDILIKAFALFLKNQNSQKQDAILIIAGGEPYKTGSGIHKGLMESLKNLAKKEGVYNQVRFMGQVDNPSRLFKIADIFVLASLSEGFGRVNAEAMANGLPVISSCTGGIPEVVKNGITGFLCRPGDIMDFSEKMKILANNPDLRIQLGRAGQKRVKKFFSLQTSIDKIHTVWNLGDIND